MHILVGSALVPKYFKSMPIHKSVTTLSYISEGGIKASSDWEISWKITFRGTGNVLHNNCFIHVFSTFGVIIYCKGVGFILNYCSKNFIQGTIYFYLCFTSVE